MIKKVSASLKRAPGDELTRLKILETALRRRSIRLQEAFLFVGQAHRAME